MPEDQNPNVARIENAGQLTITERNGDDEFVVPLVVAYGEDDTGSAVLNIFEGGVVWEDNPYLVSFEFQTTAPIRRATLSVNDNNALRTVADHRTMVLGGDTIFTHTCEVDAESGGFTGCKPFALTCGFSRVEIRVEFFDGPDVFLATPDIVSLDEPVRNGQTGESAEESNIMEMYRALTKVERNQAAEWMFANGGTTLINRKLSFDKNTDWAYAPISMRLQVASDALDCIFDGLEDTSDAFPTTLGVDEHAERKNRRDTDENREVRALISSMEDQVRRIRDALSDMLERSDVLLQRLKALLQYEGARRHHSQSLPAIQMFEQHVKREGELHFMAKDLHWRIAEMLTFVDDPNEGFGEVGDVPFRVAERTGVYANDTTYSQLHEAMRVWSICASEPLERVDVSLHAIKPDKLFEYSALHKMLDWLWNNGFEEDISRSRPIDRYEYSLADWYPKFRNEARCANTYHLVRREGHGDATQVDLYYQPVIYLGDREENGIDLHRVPGDDGAEGGFWTPDYLLAIRGCNGEKCYLVDAKYCRAGILHAKLDECFGKYVAQTTKGQGRPGTGISGVVLLAGKLDAPPLDVSETHSAEGTFLKVIAPFNRHTGKQKLTQFFQTLGIDPKET